ncbi:MAG: hypothetical protein R2818_13220 [Flavobacteriales bacterium]
MKERYLALLPIMLFAAACAAQDPIWQQAASSSVEPEQATAIAPGTFTARHTQDADRSEPTIVARKSRADGDVDAPPSFPQRVDTGDDAADDATLREAKQRWMIEHPEAYRAYIQALKDRIPEPHE